MFLEKRFARDGEWWGKTMGTLDILEVTEEKLLFSEYFLWTGIGP